MWLHSIKIKDLKCFKGEHPYEFSKHINLFVGANNSGKSTLMRALHLPEMTSQPRNCVRIKAKAAFVELRFEDLDERFANDMAARSGGSSSGGVRFSFVDNHTVTHSLKFASDADWGEPRHFNFGKTISHKDNIFHPFLSGRKVGKFEEQTNEKTQQEIRTNLSNLQQRLMRLTDPGSDHHERFKAACLDIIGHPINSFVLNSGTGAGFRVDEDNEIALADMGEGVPNILGLIVNLFSDQSTPDFPHRGAGKRPSPCGPKEAAGPDRRVFRSASVLHLDAQQHRHKPPRHPRRRRNLRDHLQTRGQHPHLGAPQMRRERQGPAGNRGEAWCDAPGQLPLRRIPDPRGGLRPIDHRRHPHRTLHAEAQG